MANSLNRELEGCEVILRRSDYPDDPTWNEEANRTVLVVGGFGASAKSNGNALFVRDRWGKSWRAEGYMVEWLVREVPADERDITYIVTVMSDEGLESFEVEALTTSIANNKVIEMKGWKFLPRRIGNHDDTFVNVDGVEYAVSPKMKDAPE